jgi:putative acetyltransferase
MSVVEDVRRSSREMVRELGFFRSLYGDSGITSFQAHILIELGLAGPLTLTDLATTLRADLSSCSRTIAAMIERGTVRPSRVPSPDKRRKLLELTAEGRRCLSLVNAISAKQVSSALSLLDPSEQQRVRSALALYSEALARAGRIEAHRIRPLTRDDDAAMRAVIVRVLEDFGESEAEVLQMLPELASLSRFYRTKGAQYWVVERDGKLMGGAGIAPLRKLDAKTCELQKMYVLPEARGYRLGERLLETCLAFAREAGYRRCYLDTRADMKGAIALYERFGFRRLPAAAVDTGHFTCDVFFEKRLADAP